MAERADDSPADLLDPVGDGGVRRWLALEKAWLAARCSASQIDALQEDAMAMEVHIERTAKPLEKRDRSWVDLLPLHAAFDRLVDVMLTNRRAADRMDLGREVLGRGHPVA